MHRILFALLLLGCHHDAPPAAPVPPASPLQLDLGIFCGDGMKAHMGSANEWGPWLEPQLKSPEMKQHLADLKSGKIAIMEFLAQVRGDVASTHMGGGCPTADAMERPASPAP
jgi:hypothetical protein